MNKKKQCQTLSIPEACQVLGICRSTGYKLVRQKKLPGMIFLGDTIRVSKIVINNLLRDKIHEDIDNAQTTTDKRHLLKIMRRGSYEI